MSKGSWFVLVSDDSGHEYVIPEKNREHWYAWIEAEDYEDEFPSYAHRVDGGFRFKSWEE